MPTTRAVRPRWLLEEMELDYNLVRVSMEMSRSSEYEKLHPHGKVPILVDEDVTIFESAAICAYLADQYQDKNFAPSIESSARADYYQWLFYASATLEKPVEEYMFIVLPGLPEKVLPKQEQTKISTDEVQKWFAKVCDPLDELLANKQYLVENRFTAADVVVGGVFLWALKLGMLKESSPVKDYITRLMERPGFQKADEDFYAKVS